MRGVANANGYVDVALLIRLPGYQGTSAANYADGENFATLGEESAQFQRQGQQWENLGGSVEIPNVDGQLGFYWFCQGTTIDSAEVWVQMQSYETY